MPKGGARKGAGRKARPTHPLLWRKIRQWKGLNIMKPNRRWIMRQVAKGNMEAKCTNKFTDDYAFDNAYNFGKTDWMPARLNPVRVYGEHGCINSHEQYKDGFISFDASDFSWSSGGAYYNDDGTISLYGAREHYNLRLVAPIGSTEEKAMCIPANLLIHFAKKAELA